ncbi:MAG: SufE family protein [Alphaproteobacteria bacterium]|nr:SufE family protein [Alphaproteobacteria bacterium]
MTYQEMKYALSLVESPIEKLEMVMDFGKFLPEIPNDVKCSDITGCTSFVKICRYKDKFYGAADSAMVRGIVAMILAMIDDKSVNEIRNFDFDREFKELNLNFGASRLNGIQSMISFFRNL